MSDDRFNYKWDKKDDQKKDENEANEASGEGSFGQEILFFSITSYS